MPEKPHFAIYLDAEPVIVLHSLTEAVERIGLYMAMWGPTARSYQIVETDKKGNPRKVYDHKQTYYQGLQRFDHHVYQYRYNQGRAQPRWSKES